jgi:hypothetical protein
MSRPASISPLGARRVLLDQQRLFGWNPELIDKPPTQWQMEGLRRLEIPSDMQPRYGFAPLGAADGPVNTAIFSGSSARAYAIKPDQHAALGGDRFYELKATYEQAGPARSNLHYGYVQRTGGRGPSSVLSAGVDAGFDRPDHVRKRAALA